jgi:hypothetical protein
MAALQARDVEVDVDYGQFYARRAGAPWTSNEVTTVGYEQHLWTDGWFVYIGTTKRYGPTPVRVEGHDGRADDPDDSWQHVVEVSLQGGGPLELYSWAPSEPEATIEIDPGPVRLRAGWRGLVPGRIEGLDDEGNSDEELLLQLWPAEPAPDVVLRCWEERALPEPSNVSPQGLRQIEGYEDMMPVLARLELRARLAHPNPRMPGGSEHSSVHTVLFDPEDGSWWVDGYDVRRTLREVTPGDAAELLDAPRHRTWGQ